MELSESTKRNASEMTPAWWWPEKESLEARRPRAPLQPPALTVRTQPAPEFMTSHAVFFTLCEALSADLTVSFAFRAAPGEPPLRASVHADYSTHHFLLEKGTGALITAHKVLDETEAQQRLMGLVENPSCRHTQRRRLRARVYAPRGWRLGAV